jgi:hypothetical protein
MSGANGHGAKCCFPLHFSSPALAGTHLAIGVPERRHCTPLTQFPFTSGATFAQGVPMLTVLIVVLILAALFSAPTWPYSRGWGYYPSGGLGLVLIVVLLFLFFRG